MLVSHKSIALTIGVGGGTVGVMRDYHSTSENIDIIYQILYLGVLPIENEGLDGLYGQMYWIVLGQSLKSRELSRRRQICYENSHCWKSSLAFVIAVRRARPTWSFWLRHSLPLSNRIASIPCCEKVIWTKAPPSFAGSTESPGRSARTGRGFGAESLSPAD